MRFLQGASLGVAIGCLVAAIADVYRTWAALLGVVAFVLVVVLTFRGAAGSPRQARRPGRRPGGAPAKASGPRTATGFFVGRRLGDALAWLAQQHGVGTLESVQVTEDTVLVTDLGPRGRRISAVEFADGAFTVDTADIEPEPGAGLDTSGRFQARDLAPDVLDRVLQRAARTHPATWTDVTEPTARIEQPDRLRGEVTVQLVNGAAGFEDATLWASAAGDLLYLQRTVG